ncbi:MAG: Rz1-like lysis system protein LysC [Stenotrophomonas sp.]|uniref:Rz1-like lysis system protein LysC n=1 Tax=Stenotrophomonas sp. TaxID=69392 RepID=UPI003D6CFB56
MPRHSIALIALVLLAGCAHQPEKPQLPEVVHVTIEKLVPVDERLTKPCKPQRAASRTVEAVVAAYNANVTALEDCDGRMSEIRALGR